MNYFAFELCLVRTFKAFLFFLNYFSLLSVIQNQSEKVKKGPNVVVWIRPATYSLSFPPHHRLCHAFSRCATLLYHVDSLSCCCHLPHKFVYHQSLLTPNMYIQLRHHLCFIFPSNFFKMSRPCVSH